MFGASFDNEFRVKHCYADTMEGIAQFRGSKYVQSVIGDTYMQAKQFLEQGSVVLFTGTPCQIGGLRSYLSNDYANLYCQDIVCHGVPAPVVWEKYMQYRQGCGKSKIQRISFRDKTLGWKNYRVAIDFQNGKEYRQASGDDFMMQAFLGHVCLRPSCHQCQFKSLHRQSDITLGDFWGIQDEMPEMDDDRGTSLLIVNSDEGKKLLENIQSDLVVQKTDIQRAVSHNPAMIRSVDIHPKRNEFMREIVKKPFDKVVKKYCTLSPLQKMIRLPRRVVSKIKRTIMR